MYTLELNKAQDLAQEESPKVWYDTDDNEYDVKPRARGVRKAIRPLLGKELGKWSYCKDCDKITLNVPGKTYSNQPLETHEFEQGWVYRDGERVVVTRENMADLYFACAECGDEKFWQWSYCCPVCDYNLALILEVTEPTSSYWAAMEFGGNPQDWDEYWKCLLCGHEYWISNANY